MSEQERAKIGTKDGESWEGPLPMTVGWDFEPGSYKIHVSRDDNGVIVVEVSKG